MGPRRLLAAAVTTVLAASLLSGVPSAAGEVNGPESWTAMRVLKQQERENAVDLYAGRHGWALMAREFPTCEECRTVHRLRERVSGQGWGKPRNIPPKVSGFAADTNARGATWITYTSGGIMAAMVSPGGRRVGEPVMLGKDHDGSWETMPTIEVGMAGRVLIRFGETWYERAGDGAWSSYGGPDSGRSPVLPGWVRDTAFTESGDLLAFFVGRTTGELQVSRRGPGSSWSTPQTVAGAVTADYVETARGGRLVTHGRDGAVLVWDYLPDDGSGGFGFTRRDFAAGSPTSVVRPQVLVDGSGTLTVAWRDPAEGGGTLLWQEDRPGSSHLERGNVMVPGTRNAETTVVTAPRGTLTVASVKDGTGPGPVVVRHLPAGKSEWTSGIRLVTPKPPSAQGAIALGTPQRDGDLRIAVNDRTGVWMHAFDAPDPITKTTHPVRRVVRKRAYALRWQTTWGYADRWKVRYRTQERRGLSAWRPLAIDPTTRKVEMIRPFGETRCYQTRGFLTGGGRTGWSEQRCVTVRK